MRQDPTAQEFLAVEAIQGNLLRTKDRIFAFIRVQGPDNSLQDEEGHRSVTDRFVTELGDQKEPYQLISLPRTVDTYGMIRELKELRCGASDARLRLIDGEIASLEAMARDGAKEPLIFLKIWASPNGERELLARAAVLTARLQNSKVAAKLMDDGDILRICQIYAELGVWQREDAPSDIPMLPGRKRLFSRGPSPEKAARIDLLERITPVGGFSFQAAGLMVGSAYCRCYGVVRYPANIDYGWAVRLMGATDCITCVTYYPGNAAELGDALSRSVKASRRDAESQSDVRAQKRYLRKASDADRLIDEQDGGGAVLGHMSIVVMPFAHSPEALEEVCREVTARFGRKQMKLRVLSLVQRDAYRHICPYCPEQPVIKEMLGRILPLETLMGGYPCTVDTIRDDHGVYFAKTPDKGILSLDVRVRAADRTNGNGIVTGIPGTGKSTMLKHLLESFYMQGIKIIVLDPEREFRELCKNLGGVWLDAGGGSARCNLLQPMPQPPDPEDKEAFRSVECPLPAHIQHVETIFQYKFPGLTDTQLALLDRALRTLYAQFGMDMDTWVYQPDRPPEQYPIMEDLYRLLLQWQDAEPACRELALLTETMAVGADSVIWNGHTNIDFSADLLVLDTHRLHNSSPRNRAAQYYNLMRMIFTVVSADRDTPYAVIADEGQTMLDPELPSAARALKDAAQRFRKYEGCLWLAFHSLNELLDPRIRLEGQSILDAASYKILFGTDGRNLADTVSLFHLTPAEEKVLAARQRGRALALIGAQRLKVDFDLPAYKLALMGTGGGR